MAHRGASVLAAENSLEAFLAALKMGVDGVEMDLRVTADGVVVCRHDRRIADGQGRKRWLDAVTFSEAKSLLGKLETLAEVLAGIAPILRSKKTLLELDVKSSGFEKTVVEILKKNRLKNVLVSSPDIWVLKRFDDLLPGIKLGLSYGLKDGLDLVSYKPATYLAILLHYTLKPLTFRFIRRKTAIGDIDVANIHYRMLNQKVVDFLHQYNIKVYTWGTEDDRKLNRLFKMGVDALKVKDPERLKAIL